jgi:phage terminase large subunit
MTTLQLPTPEWALPLLKPSRYKGAWGGRGSGKSHMFAELMIESHIIDQKRRSVCVREIQKSLNQSVKRLLETKIEAMNAGAYFEVQDAVIKSRKGDGAIIFQGMQNHTAESIKSLEGYDCAWVEEAQSLSQTSLGLLRPTIRKPESELWFTWNPNLPTDPVDQLLRGTTPPKGSTILKVNYTDNPWFPDVLRDEMEYDRRRDLEKYEHVWLGGYLTNSNSQVLAGKVRVDEFTPEPDWNGPYLGADWGFAQDPTTAIKAWVAGRSLYVEHEAYKIGLEIDQTAEFISQRIPGIEAYTIRADSARPETISYLKRHGLPRVEGVKKWPGSVMDGIAHLRSYDEIIVHPRCKETIQETRLYSYKVDKLSGDILPDIVDSNNHCIDALRYALGPLIKAPKQDIVMDFF